MPDEKPVTTEISLGDGAVVKTAKQLEKEAAKAAKLAKLQQKQAAQAAQQTAAPKEKAEVSCKIWLNFCVTHTLFHELKKKLFACRKNRK